MKTIKTVPYVGERTTVESITCDLCGRTEKGDDWKDQAYDAEDITIKRREGDSYPDGGSGKDYEIDCCPTCFMEKLIPFVKSLGGTPTVTDWEF